MNETPPAKVKPSERPHYVNNAEFSKAVVEHVVACTKARKNHRADPMISEYIGSCLLKIAEGLSHKPNFVRYSYREDMVMDAVENCIRAVSNFNVNAGTRTGLPNAFAYFTQICYFAFIRRIQKEKKIQDIKLLYMEHAGIENFADWGTDDSGTIRMGEGIVERIRNKVDQIHQRDQEVKTFGKKLKKQAKAVKGKKKHSTSLESFLKNS